MHNNSSPLSACMHPHVSLHRTLAKCWYDFTSFSYMVPYSLSNWFFSTTWKAKYNFLCPYSWINLASSWLLSWLFSSWLSISLNWVYVALLRLWCLKENRLSFAKAWYYYCYFCEKLFLPFYLLKDYVSTKLFSSNCRPLCGLIFLLIWFLSRQLTLYFRSRRWLKT